MTGWVDVDERDDASGQSEIVIAGIVYQHVVAASKCVPLELQH
jgi:hypothetical protein